MESTGFSPSFENTMDALSRTHPHAYAYYQRLRARLGHPLHPDNQRRPLEKPPTRLRFLFAASQEQKAQYQRNDDAEAQRYIRMHEGMVQEHQKIGTTVGHEGQVYSQDDYQRWSTAAKQGEREFRLARTKYTNKNLDPGEQRRAERFHLRQFEIQSEWDEQFCAQREYEDRIRRFADPVKNAARACSPTAATEHGLLTPKSSPILAPKRSPEQIRVEFASAVRERVGGRHPGGTTNAPQTPPTSPSTSSSPSPSSTSPSSLSSSSSTSTPSSPPSPSLSPDEIRRTFNASIKERAKACPRVPAPAPLSSSSSSSSPPPLSPTPPSPPPAPVPTTLFIPPPRRPGKLTFVSADGSRKTRLVSAAMMEMVRNPLSKEQRREVRQYAEEWRVAREERR